MMGGILKLMVSSSNGCVDTISKTIEIFSSKVIPPVVPNAFSPNGDHLNDVYLIRGGPFTSVEFKIYNEWGNLIFETNDAKIGWDGTYKNLEQSAGAYTYTLKATLINGTSYRKSGDLTLIR